MRWLRFMYDGSPTYGYMVEQDLVVPISGTPFSRQDARPAPGAAPVPYASLELLVPVVPQTFYAVGRNYRSHIDSVYRASDPEVKDPERPEIGYRANNALLPHGAAIRIPADATEKVHYEGELVAVIGKKGKHISEQRALEHVFGYTIGNDVSERTWQKTDRTMWRSKNTDTFKPMGPWMETHCDLEAMHTNVRVNGELKTSFQTCDMIFGVARYISTISQYFTLYPGDVLWMGTAGTSPDLRDGDVVDIEITGIGTLSNKVVREPHGE
ncbi:2-keto-4-pentenoate hydratase [Bordetella genomosp. 10]|uniref:2-keto-4-pentenoate hydratase n=1 Tax=Bordetella genomosp. 10 TaxID=1416804 RepID=A0A261S421_9BORD|nr:fumarylacetoacetate hydrolase family protein [Bordetella genomosp. 10]OZI32086.1 2-keto-4-pentenoate hydratase [Bordetella genomosp. 10]